MSSSKEDDSKKKKEELKKKLSSVKQMNLFGLKNYKVTQQIMKKVKKMNIRKWESLSELNHHMLLQEYSNTSVMIA